MRRELDKPVNIGPLREVPARHMSYQRSPSISHRACDEAAWGYLETCNIAFHDKVIDRIAIESASTPGISLGVSVQGNRLYESGNAGSGRVSHDQREQGGVP